MCAATWKKDSTITDNDLAVLIDIHIVPGNSILPLREFDTVDPGPYLERGEGRLHHTRACLADIGLPEQQTS